MTTASPEPVAMQQVSGRDPEGRNILAVLAKATYRIAADGRLAPAEHQLPLNEAIVRDRELRLLRADTDLYPHKPATDVVLKGHAYSGGRPSPTFRVSLRVSTVSKSIDVIGDRTCRLSAAGRLSFSAPEPLDKLPLRYDYAYGGEDKAAAARHGDPYAQLRRHLPPELAGASPQYYAYPRNPAGRGYLLRSNASGAGGSEAS